MALSIEGNENWETDLFQEDKFIKVSSVNTPESKPKKAKKRKRHNKHATNDEEHVKKRKVEIADYDSTLPSRTGKTTKLDVSDGSVNFVKSPEGDSALKKKKKTKPKRKNQRENVNKTNLNSFSAEKVNRMHPERFLTGNVSEKTASSSSSKKIAKRLSKQNETISPKDNSKTTTTSLARNLKNDSKGSIGKHIGKLNFMKNKYTYQKKAVKTDADEIGSNKVIRSQSETAFPRNRRNNKWNMKKGASDCSRSSSFETTTTERITGGKTLFHDELKKSGKRCSESCDVAFPRSNRNNKRWSGKNSKNTNLQTDSNRGQIPSDIKARQFQHSKDKSLTLKEKALLNIQAAKFRILNEKLYTITSDEAYKFFKDNSDAFTDYHLGYEQQVRKWPVNPVDLIISNLKQMPKNIVIADLGCGDAKIARTLHKCKVHSYDLVAVNEYVTCCDMAKVPLPSGSVDVVVFCLSLMGVNLNDYLQQAFRILKFEGLLKIAEVESRIDDLDKFISSTEAYGFTLVKKDISHKMFVLLDFRKMKKKNKKSKAPSIQLQPCLYKKR